MLGAIPDKRRKRQLELMDRPYQVFIHLSDVSILWGLPFYLASVIDLPCLLSPVTNIYQL